MIFPLFRKFQEFIFLVSFSDKLFEVFFEIFVCESVFV